MEFIKDILRGVAIGIANIIPGVSGGTMMVSMGIYDDVIHAVTGIFRRPGKCIRMLLPYVIGMALGITGLSFVIGWLFETWPFQTAMLFIGLIFGGLPLILPKVRGARPKFIEILIFLFFFFLIIGMQFLKAGAERTLVPGMQGAAPLFLVGMIAAATMVIPGVSGSMILMSLGYYTPIIGRINAFIVAALNFEMQSLAECMWILVPFGIGVAAGVFLVAKLVEYLLKFHERKTYFGILGLVLSSPAAVLAGMNLHSLGGGGVMAGLLLFAAGAAGAWALGK